MSNYQYPVSFKATMSLCLAFLMDYMKQALQSETSKIIFVYLVVPASEEIC